MTQPYAQDVNYWKTGERAADTWLDMAKTEIRGVGGLVTGSAQMDGIDGAVFVLMFTLGGEAYRVSWPVLALKPNEKRTPAQIKSDERAAKIQASTFLYYDVKAKCMVEKVMGAAAAFLQYRLLPSGSTAAEMGFAGRGAELPGALLLLSGRVER